MRDGHEEIAMKRFLVLIVVVAAVASLSGCQTCRRMGSWFNRGDACGEPPPPSCPPGVPRATMMIPTSPQILPGPIEIAPIN
jgi:hypothetical protein